MLINKPHITAYIIFTLYNMQLVICAGRYLIGSDKVAIEDAKSKITRTI